MLQRTNKKEMQASAIIDFLQIKIRLPQAMGLKISIGPMVGRGWLKLVGL